tara:strand:- start:6116 stop:6676 length:561 start_codon:yes stop_codon:yes gene_type:complete
MTENSPLIKVYDDFISPSYQHVIKDFISSPDTHWIYQDNMDQSDRGYSQFVHGIFDDQDNVNDHLLHNLLCGLLSKIKDEICPTAYHYRSRAILQVPIPNAPKHYAPHIDNSNPNAISFIYYPHQSSGDTYLFNHMDGILDVTTPKQGRLIQFPSNCRHAGSPPVDGRRMLININFLNTPTVKYKS